MKKAADDLDFEKAAQLRDALEDLRRTMTKTVKFNRLPYSLPVAIDPAKDLIELAEVLQLAEPPRRIEGFDISNISGTFAVASMVSFKDGRPDRSNYRRFKMKTVTGQDDFACMAETVRRRYSRLLKEAKKETASSIESAEDAVRKSEEASNAPEVSNELPAELPDIPDNELRAILDEQLVNEPATERDPEFSIPTAESRDPNGPDYGNNLPNLILIDGGKGQLNAACFELARLGLSHIPIIGLAKEFEEIYRPGESEPLRLDHGRGALKLLQRVRDESHRFANTYNAKLRIKKISESLLDEFPGIGENRKAALLKKFGSVQRLRLATVEQIAEVTGFGGKAAAELKAFLTARSV
jgi:excinuclease ABC subunit C